MRALGVIAGGEATTGWCLAAMSWLRHAGQSGGAARSAWQGARGRGAGAAPAILALRRAALEGVHDVAGSLRYVIRNVTD